MSSILNDYDRYVLDGLDVSKLVLDGTQIWPPAGAPPPPPPPPPGSSYLDEVMADDPNFYFRLDDTSNAAVDSSGNSRTGIVAGSLTVQQPPLITVGKSMTFDGSDDISLSTVTADNTPARTYEVWISTTTNTGTRTIIGRDQSASLKKEVVQVVSGLLRVLHWRSDGAQDTFTTAVNVADGTPHHVVVVFNGATSGTVQIYVDGTQVFSGTYTSSHASTPAFQVGASRSSNRWIGVLDEVAFYPTALTSARIAAHYAAGT